MPDMLTAVDTSAASAASVATSSPVALAVAVVLPAPKGRHSALAPATAAPPSAYQVQGLGFRVKG